MTATAAELLQALWEATLASTAAIALVLLLRAPLRRRCGCRAAYALWALVPAALIAVLLPAPVRQALLATVDTAPVAVAGEAALRDDAGFDWARWAPALLAPWLLGAAIGAIAQVRRQRRFRARLGRLRLRDDGLWQAEAVAGLPALVGLRPKIVVPADFDARYAPEERRLIVAHERLHARRADPAGNALAAALRCAFWFNPLLPFAIERYRRDQELACDEAVIARHPASRRAYGEAMLKAGLAGVPAPLACQWPGAHPLKERIAMLGSPAPTVRQWISGLAFASALTLACGYAAWAAQPAQAAATPQQAAADADAAAWRELVRDARVLTPPKYPKAAADARIGGKVVLLVDIDAAGDVTGVEVESATPAGVFEASAVAAAKQWKFKPETNNGRPVPSRRRVPLTFAMDQPSPAAANGAGGVAGMRVATPPKYPAEALKAKIGGKVVLLVDVAADGSVAGAQVESAEPAGVFDAAALEAVRQWKFEPRMQAGKPVAARVRVPVTFEPDRKAGAAGAGRA